MLPCCGVIANECRRDFMDGLGRGRRADAIDGKRADLTDVGGVVEHSGSDDFGELKGLIDELKGGNQHIIKVSRFTPQIKYPQKHVASRVVALL